MKRILLWRICDDVGEVAECEPYGSSTMTMLPLSIVFLVELAESLQSPRLEVAIIVLINVAVEACPGKRPHPHNFPDTDDIFPEPKMNQEGSGVSQGLVCNMS